MFYTFTSATACFLVDKCPTPARRWPRSGWTSAGCEGANLEDRTPLRTPNPAKTFVSIHMRRNDRKTRPCRLTHAPRGLRDRYSGVSADELLQNFIEGTNVDGTPHFQHHGAAGQPANQVQGGRTGFFLFSSQSKGMLNIPNPIQTTLPTFAASPDTPDKLPGRQK